ncbi:lytic transglycosylase domain-containing protein [bacterium]|nr:lytic transglycosylase domain-containing protein [bacterium]
MKKLLILFIILFGFIYIKAENFDEYSFMKNVNPKITKRTMRIIKESIDENFYMVSDVLSKKHVYMIMANESHFKQTAVGKNESGHNDKGLFQINKQTYYHMVKNGIIHDEWGKIFVAKYNIKIGLMVLNQKIKTIKNKIPIKDENHLPLMVLIAYNKGVNGLINDIKDGREDYHNYIYIKRLHKFNKYI